MDPKSSFWSFSLSSSELTNLYTTNKSIIPTFPTTQISHTNTRNHPLNKEDFRHCNKIKERVFRYLQVSFLIRFVSTLLCIHDFLQIVSENNWNAVKRKQLHTRIAFSKNQSLYIIHYNRKILPNLYGYTITF